MKRKRKIKYFAPFTAAVFLLIAIAFQIERCSSPEVRAALLFLTGLVVFLAGFAVVYRIARTRMDSRLIIDNRIMQIQAVKTLETEHGKVVDLKKDGVEIIVSCFGIMIGNRAIPYNQRGIPLRKVELDAESITLTYGTERRERITKIVCKFMGKEDQKAVADKFLYETGVLPWIKECTGADCISSGGRG